MKLKHLERMLESTRKDARRELLQELISEMDEVEYGIYQAFEDGKIEPLTAYLKSKLEREQ